MSIYLVSSYDDTYDLSSLEIFALFMLTGIFSTLLIPETKNKSLEELSNETQEGFYKGVAPIVPAVPQCAVVPTLSS